MTRPVIIIGGGLSGLYAGYLLKARNIAFKILEADNRPGGRILSMSHSDDPDNRHRLDLGPTWFWPHQAELLALLKSLNIEIFEQYKLGEALFEADLNSPVERFVPSYMESMRVVGGMDRLIDGLVKEIPERAIELDYAVSAVRSVKGSWEISCNDDDKSDLIAERVIIAAPPRVIIDKLEVSGRGLQPLITALTRVPTWMAAQAKFVASYKTPFWREQGLSGQAFSRVGPMAEIHDASAADNDSFALFGFIGIPAAKRLSIPRDELKQACLAQLVKIFGDQSLDVEKTYLLDWAENEFIASSADINEQPAHPFVDLSPYSKEIARSGLFFGGSEVAMQDAGYLRGAIVAASDAVIELCNSFS